MKKSQDTCFGNLHHKCLALKLHCGESWENIVTKNSTIAHQIKHWQMLRNLNEGIFANEFLRNNQTSSRKLCAHAKNSFTIINSHTGRIMEFDWQKLSSHLWNEWQKQWEGDDLLSQLFPEWVQMFLTLLIFMETKFQSMEIPTSNYSKKLFGPDCIR